MRQIRYPKRGLRALAACALLLFAEPANAFFPGQTFQPCGKMPPASARRPVTDKVLIFDIPNEKMAAKCNKVPSANALYGCTFLANSKHPAVIFLNASLNPEERACTLIYEKAHLPPNNWLDPVEESWAVNALPPP